MAPDGESSPHEQFVNLPVGFQWPGPPEHTEGSPVVVQEEEYTLMDLTDPNDSAQELILSEDQPNLLIVKREVHESTYLRQEKVLPSIRRVKQEDKRKRTKTGLIYTCTECNKKFQYLASLQIHKRFHSGEKLTQCDECGKRFATQYALKRHIRTHEKPETNVCGTCGAAFADKGDFERHMRYHATGEPAYKCKECDDTFDTYGAIKAHRSKKHRQHWLCRHCYAKFPTEKLYQEHRVIHETYNCPQCHMKFITQEMLDMHMEEAGEHQPPPNSVPPPIRISKDSSVYECDNCGKRFTRRDCLLEHYRLHTGLGLVACEQCPMKFTTYARLRKHMARHAEKRSYPCPQCDKIFGTERYLNIHVMKHTGEQLPYPCQLCNKQFLRSNSLRNHMFSHLKRFPCSRCSAIFTSDRQLKKHRRTHKNICSICTTTFETFELLHMHFTEYHPESSPPEVPAENLDGVPVMEGFDVDALLTEGAAIDAPTREALLQLQPQYTCEVCEKKFTRATDLRIHMCTHARSFPCSRCFQTFTSERKLKKHRKTQHKNVCNYCGVKFEQQHFLENHYKQQHPESREARGEPPLEEETPPVVIFTSQRKLKKHRKLHKNICPLCETKFDTQMDLKQHFEELHPTSKEHHWNAAKQQQEDVADEQIEGEHPPQEHSVSCLLCGDAFSRNSDLRSHMKTHERSFACRQCDAVLPTREELKEHRKVHQIICEICRESLDSVALAQLHYLEEHPDCEMPQFVVPTAEESGLTDEEDVDEEASRDAAASPTTEDAHIEEEGHENEASDGEILPAAAAPIEDDISIVNSSLNVPSIVKQEPREDSEEEKEDVKVKILLPFACEICGKRFARKVAHKNHMYSHAKSFPCTRCNGTFPSERQLKKHRKTHKTTCRYCEVICDSKDALKLHYRNEHPTSKQGRVKVPFEEVFIEANPFVEEATEANPIEEVFTVGAPVESDFFGTEILGDE
uniref:Putative zn finger n=1 Tax=Lutzomyia longipalpis TaxID=7200 RepID=A0A1B0C8T3_LUTLO